MNMREADLERHLVNNRQPEDKVDSEKSATPAKAPATKPKEDETTKPEIMEFGSKNDYQLSQALNVLKGMNILHGK